MSTTKEDVAVAREIGAADPVIGVDGDGAVEASDGVEARGYWEQIWRRFKRDRVAIGSIFFLIFVILVSYPGAIIAEQLVGHSPNDLLTDGIDDGLILVGPWSEVTNPFTGETQILVLGASTRWGGTSSCVCSTAAVCRCRWRCWRRSASWRSGRSSAPRPGTTAAGSTPSSRA